MTKVIFFIGRSGSGKGTQLKFLLEETGFELIETGKLLRERGKKEDLLGKKVAEYTTTGKLVPTPITFMAYMPTLMEFYEKSPRGVVFDGSPRKLYEAKMLEEVLEMFGWEDFCFCYIDISEEEAYKRLRKRGRVDDRDEDIKERLTWFREEVEPVIEHYRKKGALIEVNGKQSVEEVWKELKEKTGSFLQE